MSERYEHDPIELKWQKRWEEAHCNEAKTDYTKPKFYGLIEFPYPSGQGLHVGHPRPFTAMDVICRSAGWKATMCCSPWATMHSACPRRTTP